MINDPTYEQIFSDGNSYNIQYVIASLPSEDRNHGWFYLPRDYILNEDIANESFNLLESLTDGEGLRLGGCIVSEINTKVRVSANTAFLDTLDKQKEPFTIELYAFSDANKRIIRQTVDPTTPGTKIPLAVYDVSTGQTEAISNYTSFKLGVYWLVEVSTTPDKKYQTLKLQDMFGASRYFDVQFKNGVYQGIYSDLGDEDENVTIGQMCQRIQDIFNDQSGYYGLYHFIYSDEDIVRTTATGFTTNAINTTIKIPRNLSKMDSLSFRSFVSWVSEIAGGITRIKHDFYTPTYSEGDGWSMGISIEFIALQSIVADKSYSRYLQGELSFSEVKVISKIKVREKNGTEYESAGTDELVYVVDTSSNPLIINLEAADYTAICTNLGNRYIGLSYDELELGTYGDLCVEIGDVYEVDSPSQQSFVINREFTGIHKMTDRFRVEPMFNGSESVGLYSQDDEKMDKHNPTGSGCFTMNDCIASGNFSSALGTGNTVTGRRSFTTGQMNVVSGDNSTVLGVDNNDNGGSGLISGYNNTGTGTFGINCGYKNTSSNGLSNVVLGANNTVGNGNAPVAIGYGLNVNGTPYGSALGQYNDWHNGDVLEVGNGTADNARSNALRIKSDGTLEAHYTWQLVGEETANSLASLSEVYISDDIAAWASEYYVVVSFPASSTWQSYVDFVIRTPFDYPSVSLGKSNYPFIKGYYYSSSYNASIAVQANLSGNNKRIGIKTGFSQITNASATGVYSLTVYYR